MSPIRTPEPKAAAGPSDSVTQVAPRSPAGRAAPKRCAVALIVGTGQALTQEIGCLLRRRMLIACLITGAAFSIFFVSHLLQPSQAHLASPVSVVFLGALAALQVGLACLLASRVPLSVFRLRAVEAAAFGITALYFAWLQFDVLWQHNVLQWAQPEHRGDVLRLANSAAMLRWVVLIVIYGTFVPNTWRRCAAVVGGLALTPLVINAAMLMHCPYLGQYLGGALFNGAIVMALAAAIAIFGSYKISALHQEAFEARQLGQYRLTRRLGSGGMGEVYLGEHMLLRRPCAVKLIRPDQSADPTALQRFEREVQAMAHLTHWNTVEVYDYGHAEDGTFYYVMEYLPGLSLQDLVTEYGPLPPARAVHVLRQICAGLHEAHALGVIHRDIKPSNVILARRGGVADVAKLLDFGLVQCMGAAVADSKLTVQGTILGSPPYMSPEQAQGKDSVDERTDVYSVGALAYFLLTGQPPFVRDTPMQMLMAHVYEQVPRPSELRPDVPADLEAVVLRCLEKDPARRFPSAEALDEALEQCACAGQWTRHHAADWWRAWDDRAARPGADGATRDDYARVGPAPALAAEARDGSAT